MKRLCIAVIVIVIAQTGATMYAADGTIPIWGPTTITERGSYILTRDIPGDSTTPVSLTIDHAS